MLGHPIYKEGDFVSFVLGGQVRFGQVVVVDAYGSFFDDSEACYDIFVSHPEECIYKQIRESLVESLVNFKYEGMGRTAKDFYTGLIEIYDIMESGDRIRASWMFNAFKDKWGGSYIRDIRLDSTEEFLELEKLLTLKLKS